MSSKELKRAGLRATLPRLAVLRVLKRKGDAPLSAEGVYKALIKQGSGVGLATVYRALAEFEQVGIARRLNFGSSTSVFELDTGDNHGHLVCRASGVVTGFTDAVIEERIQEIAKSRGFKVANHTLTLYGTLQGR